MKKNVILILFVLKTICLFAQNASGTIVSPTYKYVGEYVVKNGQQLPNGKGIADYSNGDRYEGEWSIGVKEGQGTYIWANGRKYVGGYKNDKEEGHGIKSWPSGHKYVGGFKNGKYDGFGSQTGSDGTKIEGTFKDGELNGKGIQIADNGDKYEGTWENGYFSNVIVKSLNGKKKAEYKDGIAVFKLFETVTKESFTQFTDNGKYGLKRPNGSIVIPAKYEKFEIVEQLIFAYTKRNEGDIYKFDGKKIISNIWFSSNDVIKINGKKWLFESSYAIEANGASIFKLKAQGDRKTGYYRLYKSNDLIVDIDRMYTKIETGRVYGGILVEKNGKQGILDLDGKELIAPNLYVKVVPEKGSGEVYDCYKVSTTSDKYSGLEGIINNDGRCIIPVTHLLDINKMSKKKYKSKYFPKEWYEATYDNKKLILDSKGNLLFKTNYSWINPKIDSTGKWYLETHIGPVSASIPGKMTLEGKVISEPKIIEPLCRSYFYTNKGNKYYKVSDLRNHKVGIVDEGNNYIYPCVYDQIRYESGGKYNKPHLELRNNEFRGIGDLEGTVLVNPDKYHTIENVKDGYIVSNYGYMGFINSEGKELIVPNRYTEITSIEVGDDYVYRTKQNDLLGLVDKNGTTLVEPQYSTIEQNRFGITLNDLRGTEQNFTVTQNGKFGVISKSGKMLLPCMYSKIEDVGVLAGYRYFRLYDGANVGLYEIHGDWFFPAEYTSALVCDGEFTYKNKTRKYKSSPVFVMGVNNNEFIVYSADGKVLDSSDNINSQFKNYDKIYAQAEDAFRAGNYALSAKKYDEATKYYPSTFAFYNSGAAYYNCLEYKKAIEMLRLCIANHPSSTLKNSANDLITQCEAQIAQKKERRRERVLNVLGGFLSGVANAMQLQNYNRMAVSSPTTYSMLPDARIAAQNAAKEVLIQASAKAQADREEFLKRQSNFYRAYFGREPTLDEQINAYSQYIQGVNSDMVNNGQEINSSLNNSNNSHQELRQKNSDFYTEHYGSKDCHICRGSGQCQTCNGHGTHYVMGNLTECPNCLLVGSTRSGKCAACQGSGKVYGVK